MAIYPFCFGFNIRYIDVNYKELLVIIKGNQYITVFNAISYAKVKTGKQ